MVVSARAVATSTRQASSQAWQLSFQSMLNSSLKLVSSATEVILQKRARAHLHSVLMQMQTTSHLELSTSSNSQKAHLLIVNISRAQAFPATGIACALFYAEILLIVTLTMASLESRMVGFAFSTKANSPSLIYVNAFIVSSLFMFYRKCKYTKNIHSIIHYAYFLCFVKIVFF